mgnify:FL=1
MEEQELTKLYYGISEVAELLDVEQSTLRYWEKEFAEFAELCPVRHNSKRRKYTPEVITNIKHLQHLLHSKGLTIEGAKKYLRDSKQGLKASNKGLSNADAAVLKLKAIREELLAMQRMLDDISKNKTT